MQEYRVNYPLLIGLIIGTFVCSGAIYALHHFQNSRQADWLSRAAEKAVADKNYHEAVQYYQQYIAIMPEDKESRIKLGNAYLDLTELDDVAPEDISGAVQTLETILRNPIMTDVPETPALRLRFARFYARDGMRMFNNALEHLKILMDADPNNAELQVLNATWLSRSGNLDEAVKYAYKLVGYDQKKGTFDAKKATAPHAVEVYGILASILYKGNKPEVAQRVLRQMVEANPNSAAAYVSSARLKAAFGEATGAKADAQKAYQLKPEDADVLLLATDIAASDKNFDKAHEYIKTCKKLHPKEARIYQRASSLALQENKLNDAMKELDEGVKAIGGSAAMNLMFIKARLQIDSHDLKGAHQTIDDMQQIHKLVPEIADYFDALFLVADNKWYPASEALSKLRGRIGGFNKEMGTEVDFDLALCYERLGRYELALQYYQQIADQNPDNVPATAGVTRMKALLGKDQNKRGTDPLQTALVEELKKPKKDQDWSKIDAAIEEYSKKAGKVDPAVTLLVKAQVAMVRGDYDSAAKHLIEADKLSPKNLKINRAKIQLARMNSKIGPEKALEYLTKNVEPQFGDLPELRLDKADILISLNKDKQDKQQLKQDLANLASGIDKWTPQQKFDFWRGMSDRYLGLGMIEEARQSLGSAADAMPNELRVRLQLFAMALDSNDAEGMKAAQDKILQIVGDKNDSDYLYTEARRKLWLLRRGQLDKSAIKDIRDTVKKAIDQRPEGVDLYALLGEVELTANNPALALKYYDRAEELGRPSPLSVAAHIKLLFDVGRYKQAGELLDRLPEAARQTLLGPRYAEILFQTKQVDAALEEARAATENDPKNAANQFWYGQLLARYSQQPSLTEAQKKEAFGKAIQAMKKATELQPEFPDAWFALINYNLMQDNEGEAQKAMRDAQLVLSNDALPMFLAKSYEALHRWFDAETMYREIYDLKPDEVPRARMLAEFYLGPLYPRNDRKDKATPLLNQILRAGADGKVPANDPNLLWARRWAANLLAMTGDYQDLKKAENLLRSNSQEGSLLIEDKRVLADLLSRRPEPISKKKALALYEEIDHSQNLTEGESTKLGDLYFSTRADWSQYQSQMEKTISRFPNSVAARQAYVQKLLIHDDASSIDRAAQLVDELQKLAPSSPATSELTARIARKRGMQDQIAGKLRQRMPDFGQIKDLDEGKKQTALTLASLFVELNDLDSAEKIYRDLATRDPKQTLAYAKFLGEYRSVDQCFAKLNEMYSVEKLAEILPIAMSVARDRRDKIGDKFDGQLQQWITAGLRENPDSSSLLLAQGDLYDLQKRYDDAAGIYRKLLAQKDLTGVSRAVVLNNLAYLLALAGKTTATDDDPMKLVAEAAQILGPNSDILDTRAVVFMSRNQFKEAIDDLELSVTDSPTPSKYYHLAIAYLRAGNSRAAVEAWQKAVGMGLSRDSLNRMEHEQYEKIKTEIDKIRGTSRKAERADNLRKAG